MKHTWWLAAGVVVLGLGVWVLVAQRAAPAPCAPGDPFVDWAARAAPIAKAFEASGHPAWKSRLDATERGARHALTSLADTELATCRAAHAANRSATPERACTGADRQTLRALFDELAGATRTLVDRAPLATALAPRGVACRDVAIHDILRSTDPALAAELARVTARSLARTPTEVLEEATALATRVTAANAPQLEAAAKLVVGALQIELRQDASATLEAAARAAARAHDDRAVARARILLAAATIEPARSEVAITEAPHAADSAERRGDAAVTAVERAGDPAELRGELATVLGDIAVARGALVDAEAHYRRAIVAHSLALGPVDPRIAQVHQRLARVLARLGRDEDARTSNEIARGMLEQALGTDHAAP